MLFSNVNKEKVWRLLGTILRVLLVVFLSVSTFAGMETFWDAWSFHGELFSGLSAIGALYVLIAVWRGGHLVLYPSGKEEL